MTLTQYTFYIGHREGLTGPLWAPASVNLIIGQETAKLGIDAWTVQDSIGAWQNIREPSTVLTVITIAPQTLMAQLAGALATELRQDEVFLTESPVKAFSIKRPQPELQAKEWGQ